MQLGYVQICSCPRNCRRKVGLTMPLDYSGKASLNILREPGDLPDVDRNRRRGDGKLETKR